MIPPRRLLLGLLLLTLLAGPLGAYQARGAAQAAPEVAEPAAVVTLPTISENEPANPNDEPAQADPIGDKDTAEWFQTIRGAISRSDDVDYYQITLTQPASELKIRLSNLAGDYDLVLASDRNDVEQGQTGLEGITDIGGQINSIGGQINSIGGQINSIGGQINSIGGQINSIGGQINSIGGQINSISANGGSFNEEIKTFLWLPGTYFVVVAPSNGDFSATNYRLEVQLNGSGLSVPPPAPDVRLDLPVNPDITTLYITSFERMRDVYTETLQQSAIISIENQINALTALPIDATNNGLALERGFAIDLYDLTGGTRSTPTIGALYTDWFSGTNELNPFYANRVAQVIRGVVRAATRQNSCPVIAQCLIYGQAPGAEPPFPNLKHIVLVGPDDVLPQFRVPDLTTIANEADYAAYLKAEYDSAGVINPNSPQGAALKYRMLLTDAPFSGDRPYRFFGFPFFLPERSVGRLVESPEDIRRYLQWWLATSFVPTFPPINRQGFQISLGAQGEPEPAFITGYDFLKDQAAAISRTLGVAGLYTDTLDTRVALNDDLWDKNRLESRWFEGDLESEFQLIQTNDPNARHNFDLFSLNAHFDHWQLIPARTTNGTFAARRIFTPDYDPNPQNCFGACYGYFGGTLGYSVGCHSGYNVLDGDILLSPANRGQESLFRADFAQAMNRHAGTWIGNTGYGYGTADGIDYSERLALLLTQELARNIEADNDGSPVYIGSAIGEALTTAKQRYVRNSAMLTVYDVKALMIMSLYGLPFIRTSVPAPIDAPPEDPRLNAPNVPLQTNAPVPPINSLGRLERIITVTLDIDAGDYVTVPRTGSTLLELEEGDFTVEDTFVQAGFPQPKLRVYSNNQIGRPTLPTYAYDISALSYSSTEADPVRLEVRDVQFLGGIYGQTTAFNPQVTQVVTETDSPIDATSTEPNFAAGAGLWYPDKFFGYSSVGVGANQRDQLTAVAAQFKADQSGLTGTLRPYTQMVFKVLYTDPNAAQAATAIADENPPVIESVDLLPLTGNQRQAGTMLLAVRVSDGDTGMEGVLATYVQDGTWTDLALSQPNPSGAPNLWTVQIPVQAGRVQVIVSATDAAGNTAYYTAKGSFNPPPPARLHLPIIVR